MKNENKEIKYQYNGGNKITHEELNYIKLFMWI